MKKNNVIMLLFVSIISLFTLTLKASEVTAFSVENCQDDSVVTFTMAELKALHGDEITTVLPWTIQNKSYTGVYLDRFIALISPDGYEEMYVTAKNTYSVKLSREELFKHQYMLVYAIDGHSIGRREKGPLMLIRDLNGIALEDINDLDIVINLVWFVETMSINCGTED